MLLLIVRYSISVLIEVVGSLFIIFPQNYKFNKISFRVRAVMIAPFPQSKSPRISARTPCYRVCLRSRVAPLRCSFILGSGKVKKILSNLKHYDIEKFVAGQTLTQLLHLVTYMVLILCRGNRFVNGSCTCSHREDLERSMSARSRCLLFLSTRIMAFSCVSLSK